MKFKFEDILKMKKLLIKNIDVYKFKASVPFFTDKYLLSKTNDYFYATGSEYEKALNLLFRGCSKNALLKEFKGIMKPKLIRKFYRRKDELSNGNMLRSRLKCFSDLLVYDDSNYIYDTKSIDEKVFIIGTILERYRDALYCKAKNYKILLLNDLKTKLDYIANEKHDKKTAIKVKKMIRVVNNVINSEAFEFINFCASNIREVITRLGFFENIN